MKKKTFDYCRTGPFFKQKRKLVKCFAIDLNIFFFIISLLLSWLTEKCLFNGGGGGDGLGLFFWQYLVNSAMRTYMLHTIISLKSWNTHNVQSSRTIHNFFSPLTYIIPRPLPSLPYPPFHTTDLDKILWTNICSKYSWKVLIPSLRWRIV